MTEKQRPPLSDAERMVLKELWEHGPQTVRAVHESLAGQGQEWSRSTVITLLQRLEKKGYAHSDRSGFAFVFHPSVSREEVMHDRMVELAGELCDGDAVPLVMAFANRHSFRAEEIERFRQMIRKLAPKERKRGPR